MTRSGTELNRLLASSEFDLEKYETLGDLLDELGIPRGAAHSQYAFIGKRWDGDVGVPLMPESSLHNLNSIVVISHHIGG
jgi:hypothetical protein